MSGLPVDDDIIDRILTFSPDFSSLKSLILTCVHFHAVFKTRPSSIVYMVAYNVVGPSLPHALRFSRFKAGELQGYKSNALPKATEEMILTNQEIRDIIHVRTAVRELEDLYSWR